ncbi:MAG: GtrA family protein [Methanobrevibacter sp.]|mgnify:CR=1 FL=1|nr:GtrA family protein [Methanobrevibacter sp.]
MNKLLYILFRKGTDNIYLQFFRYIFVGGTSFLVDFAIYYSLITFFGVNYLISAVIAFLISVLWNYYTSTKWVFNQDEIGNRVLEFNLFIVISVIGLVFTEIFLFIFHNFLHIDYVWSKIIASVLVMFWNFAARRVMFYGSKFNKKIN